MKKAVGYIVILPDGHSERFSSYQTAFDFVEFCSLLGLYGLDDARTYGTIDTIWEE